MSPFADRLEALLREEVPKLRAISDRSSAVSESSWSAKQELGHLIDSATMNRIRFLKAALENHYTGPTYDGAAWAELGGYAGMPWTALVDLWIALNQALAVLLDRIPAERLAAQCHLADAPPLSLEFLIDDYILHTQHHLDHILQRARLTAYPGAAFNV